MIFIICIEYVYEKSTYIPLTSIITSSVIDRSIFIGHLAYVTLYNILLLFFDVILQIVLWGRTEKSLQQTAEEVREMGVKCSYMICDVSKSQEIYNNVSS